MGELNRALFGDFAGDRADYTLGTFYQCRRIYFAEGGKTSLRPTENMMMTKEQSKRFGQKTTIKTSNLHFSSGNHNAEKSQKKKAGVEKKKKKKDKTVYIQKFASTNAGMFDTCNMFFIFFIHAYISILPEPFLSFSYSDEWREEMSAGCKIWIHKSGEVIAECPWTTDDQQEDVAAICNVSSIDLDDENVNGVFSNPELHELFSLADIRDGKCV